jgi:hypothetical protein
MGVFLSLILVIGVLQFILFWILSLIVHDEINQGDRIYIYFDDLLVKFNRIATIDDISDDRILIYNKLPLPLDYVGKFYAVGRTPDGVKLIYVKEFIFVYMAVIAELFRKGDNGWWK